MELTKKELAVAIAIAAVSTGTAYQASVPESLKPLTAIAIAAPLIVTNRKKS
jgi:hypothetical protein